MSLWENLSRNNIVPKLQAGGMLGNGHYIDTVDKKVHRLPGIDVSRLWIYTNPDPEMYCKEYQAIERGFGFIPRRCMQCWKIVVEIQTFHQLMLIYDLQKVMVEKNPRCWCKLGCEERSFVPRHYGAYFYTKGREVGEERWKTVRENVDQVAPGLNVILKRGCTEFELKHGPSNLWEYSDQFKALEDQFWANVNVPSGAVTQPKMVRDYIKLRWMDFAWGRGDMSVMIYNNRKPLHSPLVTYHGELA